jgi:hypothetical protein
VRVLVHHVDLRQPVTQAGLKIVRIVRRSYLYCTRAKFGLRQFVGDDRNLAPHQRQQNFLAVQMRVTLILRVYRDGGIPEHRLRACRRYGDEFIRADNRVANLPQLSGHVLVLHFEVGDRGFVPRAPVYDVVPAVDQTFFIQANEHLAHRTRKIFVHGEVFAVPVDGGPEALHLIENGATIELFPFPNALDEFLAAQVTTLLALFDKVAFHHHLCGDAGVIGAGEPQRDESAHAMPAHNDVHLRLVEHVAHV